MSDGTHFAASWLTLREPVDARSRAAMLVSRLAVWLEQRSTPLAVLDLGAGSGSNLRYLAPRLPLPQQWTLIDQDAGLLSRAERQLPSTNERLGVTTRCVDMGRWSETPDALADWLAGVDLVTAAALLDLVSQQWIDALAAAAARQQVAVLIALSVDGDWQLETVHPDHGAASEWAREDQWIRQHYRAHQATDKGVGAALGGEAPAAMASALQACGYRVQVAESPWVLHAPMDSALGEALLDGWRVAVGEQLPHAVAEIEHWHAVRLAAWQRGELVIRVGHRDLLALPDNGAQGDGQA